MQPEPLAVCDRQMAFGSRRPGFPGACRSPGWSRSGRCGILLGGAEQRLEVGQRIESALVSFAFAELALGMLGTVEIFVR